MTELQQKMSKVDQASRAISNAFLAILQPLTEAERHCVMLSLYSNLRLSAGDDKATVTKDMERIADKFMIEQMTN